MPDRRTVLIRAAVGLILLAAAFAVDRQAFQFFRTVTLYDHWGEMREGLTAAKFLASGLGTLLAGLIVAHLDPKGWRRAGTLWLAVLVAASLNSGIKVLAGRERPSYREQVRGHERTVFRGPSMGLHHASCQSFPSGHTLSGFASATVLAAFYPPAAPVFYAVAVGTGINRVVKHQHFLSDVVAGALLGHLAALWVLGWRRVRSWWEDPRGP